MEKLNRCIKKVKGDNVIKNIKNMDINKELKRLKGSDKTL